ncbi:sulfate ABC transporter permease [Vulcanococcus limneticus]|uniref:sulfate ABC transporter permease n=1 Tax=Vulcanococcus limneticus TaxID=2170428 RepID=UPI000B98467C|nr:sulfate ABC transporter permease subunit [Vulcanococcus limneticus]MCP9791075.1 sulfate ABC transporter permease [Vulcanococcus limneticus MW73D5]MCP9892299.1 sulfate ABC transporter permease [Vulcanococcus limneticus Candia 3F8]MCP9895879.1 sulfate ABC transporter permease [Vulcanococcus limneticus Candia 3B3]
MSLRTPTGWGPKLLIAAGLSFLTLVVLLPVLTVFVEAFSAGLAAYWGAITQPPAVHALQLTLLITAIAVPLNTVFGLLISWILARRSFRGQAVVLALLDLPLSISPIVVGFMFILLFSPEMGLFADAVERSGVKIVFATPGLALTLLFVTVPFVAREVYPALQEVPREEEEAARCLGASPWRTFWSVTLPHIRPALIYGVILCTARAVGEFGAISVVSGKIINATNTLTLHVERTYLEYDGAAAFACASLLGSVALLSLLVQTLVRHQDRIREP